MCSVSRTVPAAVRVEIDGHRAVALVAADAEAAGANRRIARRGGSLADAQLGDVAEAIDTGAAFRRRRLDRHRREQRDAVAHLAANVRACSSENGSNGLASAPPRTPRELADLRQRGGGHHRLILERAAAVGVHFDDGCRLQAAGQDDASAGARRRSLVRIRTRCHTWRVPLNRVRCVAVAIGCVDQPLSIPR